MFKNTYLTTLIILVSIFSHAQKLPMEWSISNDGRKLEAGGKNDTGFYSLDDIHDIKLQFDQTDWWDQMTDNYDAGIDILATCWIDGIQYDSIGVRFKGQTSYKRNNTEKKSFNLSLDYMIEGQEVDGYSTINMNCGWDDDTSMREVLFNNVGLNYYMALKTNYSNLTINDQNWGPYQTVQQFNGTYIKEWYESNDGTIWRALKIGGTTGGPGGGGGSNFGAGTSTLNYNGPDSTDYNTHYTLKRTEQEDPWAGLIAACDVLNNEPLETLEGELMKVLDIDKTCWFLAHELIFADDDSYIFKGGMDYYVYFDAETQQIIPMEYDGNSVLGDKHKDYPLFYNEDNSDFPLLNRMLAVPSIRQRFLAHSRVIFQDYFSETYINGMLDDLETKIDPLVQEDPKKFYTYAEFLSAIDDLKTLINNRRILLMSDPEIAGIESLAISDVSYSVDNEEWKNPTADDEVHIATFVAGDLSSVWLHYGAGFSGQFTKVEMFDDGSHNDGTAQDGKFGAIIPTFATGTFVRYYIEAISNDNANTATYEPKGTEHNVYLYQVSLIESSTSNIAINEVMANNDTSIADEAGEFEDWIELFNTSVEAVDISGWSLTDDINEPNKYVFADGTSINSNEYLMVWADNDVEQGALHAAFKLSSSGEQVFLLNMAGEQVDIVTIPASENDRAYARRPNGTGPFQFQNHSYGENNELVSGITDIDQASNFQLFPNPVRDILSIVSLNGSKSDVKISNAIGQVYWEGTLVGMHDISVLSWPKGVYILSGSDGMGEMFVVE